MIYKVFYQEKAEQVPVRENTKTLYVEADSEREVRKKLADRKIMIEFIRSVDGEYLTYEQQSPNFKVENL